MVINPRVADRGGVGLPAFAPGEGDQQDAFADHAVHRRAQYEFHGPVEDGWYGGCFGHCSLFRYVQLKMMINIVDQGRRGYKRCQRIFNTDSTDEEKECPSIGLEKA